MLKLCSSTLEADAPLQAKVDTAPDTAPDTADQMIEQRFSRLQRLAAR